MKYIDADCLRAKIEKYLTFDNNIDTAFYIGRRDAERSILSLIDSLQQEQPEASNNLVDVDTVREDFITEVYRVLDADPTNDRANAIIDAFDSLPTVSREQPEVDLEKEYKEYVDDDPVYSKLVNHFAGMAIARHFYELGLNARKEDKI